MNIFRLAFELFIIYMVYKLIFEFIIPVYKTTKHMKQKMTEMQQRMQDQQEANHYNHTNADRQNEPQKKSYQDDYIEYEEVK